jgi:N-methylhydantoinase A/oxoprolinase/acetone carboxylase beta subunit
MWRVGVDSGGTFTDVCLVDATTGDVRVWKVPSTPDDPSRAIAHGVVEGLREAAEATPAEVDYFGHGTTVATNALIQHRGAATGLITTEGFRDLLEIGRQRRPHLLGPGQSVAIITPGAGGYGDPRERDRALVRRDLAEGTISPAVARDAYGLTDRP